MEMNNVQEENVGYTVMPAPSLLQTMRRDWRAMQRRRAHRRACNPSMFEVMGMIFKNALACNTPRHHYVKQSTPWDVRWPALAMMVGMVRRRGPKRNFFQMIWDDLRPLRMAFGMPIRKPKKKNKQVQQVQDMPVTMPMDIEQEQDPKLKALREEKELRIAAVKEQRTWKDRVKGLFGRSELDQLDKEFDELMAERRAEIQSVSTSMKKEGQELGKIAQQNTPSSSLEDQSKMATVSETTVEDTEEEAEELEQPTSSVWSEKIREVLNFDLRSLFERTEKSVPAVEKSGVLSINAAETKVVSLAAEKAEMVQKLETILVNRAQVLSSESSMEVAPDLSKLGNSKRLKAILNPMIDALRVKTSLTDHEMGEITLMSHIVNAYGSGRVNYLNNLHVNDRFQLEVARSVAKKLQQNGIDVPFKERRIKNAAKSRSRIHKWRLALENKNRHAEALAISSENRRETNNVLMSSGRPQIVR